MDHANVDWPSIQVYPVAPSASAGSLFEVFYLSPNSSAPISVTKFLTGLGGAAQSAFKASDGFTVVSDASVMPSRRVSKRFLSEEQVISSEDIRATALVRKKLDLIYCNDAAAVTDASHSRIAIRVVVDTVEDYLADSDIIGLNNVLSKTDPTLLRKITSVALLRSSYRVKDKLSAWPGLYASVWAHLKATDQNPEQALRGLLRSKVSSLA